MGHSARWNAALPTTGSLWACVDTFIGNSVSCQDGLALPRPPMSLGRTRTYTPAGRIEKDGTEPPSHGSGDDSGMPCTNTSPLRAPSRMMLMHASAWNATRWYFSLLTFPLLISRPGSFDMDT